MRKNERIEVVRDYCLKWPDIPTMTLARKLYKEQGTFFTDIEDARSKVRYCRGEYGSEARTHAAKAGTLIQTTKNFSAPRSDARPLMPYVFEKRGFGTILSDTHYPYHDSKALEPAIEYAVQHGATKWLLINGDLLDCYQISDFRRDPRLRTFASELEGASKLVRDLMGVFESVTLKLGNHEDRWENYMLRKAPELLDMPWTSWDRMLGIEGLPIVGARQLITAGPLTILHGHEIAKTFGIGPVSPARWLFTKAKGNAICGHFHQPTMHSESTISDDSLACWSTGCLCNRRPEYDPGAFLRWKHGFATVDLQGKLFEVVNHTIIGGKVV